MTDSTSLSRKFVFHKFKTTYEYINKKFCEELIAYFLWYDTGHIENEASKNLSIVLCVFITAVTYLQSRCLATTGEILSIPCLATIRGLLPSRCLATIGWFLPSRCLGTMGGYLPSRCLSTKVGSLPSRRLATIRGLLPSRCLAAIGGIHTHTRTATRSHKPTLFFQSKKSTLKMEFWEELIAYFPLIGHGPQRKRKTWEGHTDGPLPSIDRIDTQTARGSYKPHKPKKLGGHIDTQTARWSHKPLKKN
jgi:hypothetical protein